MENWEKKDRTFAEADKLLINQSLETIDGNFDNLPTTHPVKGPYQKIQPCGVKLQAPFGYYTFFEGGDTDSLTVSFVPMRIFLERDSWVDLSGF